MHSKLSVKAENGEKIEYSSYRNQQETEEMKSQLQSITLWLMKSRFTQMPIPRWLSSSGDKDTKNVDVVLPAGACLGSEQWSYRHVKSRIKTALEKEGLKPSSSSTLMAVWDIDPTIATLTKGRLLPVWGTGTLKIFPDWMLAMQWNRQSWLALTVFRWFRTTTSVGLCISNQRKEVILHLSRQGRFEPILHNSQTGTGQSGWSALELAQNTMHSLRWNRLESGFVQYQREGRGYGSHWESQCVPCQERCHSVLLPSKVKKRCSSCCLTKSVAENVDCRWQDWIQETSCCNSLCWYSP